MQTPLVVLNGGKSKKRAADLISADCSKVPHYWAVLRAPSGTAGNMVFKTWMFEDQGVANKDLPKLNKKTKFNVDIPMLINTTPIKVGEILMLPA